MIQIGDIIRITPPAGGTRLFPPYSHQLQPTWVGILEHIAVQRLDGGGYYPKKVSVLSNGKRKVWIAFKHNPLLYRVGVISSKDWTVTVLKKDELSDEELACLIKRRLE